MKLKPQLTNTFHFEIDSVDWKNAGEEKHKPPLPSFEAPI